MLPGKLGVASVPGQLVVRSPKQRAGWFCASLPSIHPWCWHGWLKGYASGKDWGMLHLCGWHRHRPRETSNNSSFRTS